MKTLVIGCGRAREIHYNPLYSPRAGTLDGYSAQAVRERRIVQERLCSHSGDDVVTIDIEQIKCPTFTANVMDAQPLADILAEVGGQVFDLITLENFPYTVLIKGDKGHAFFGFCKKVLKGNGELDLYTGSGAAGSAKTIAEALTAAGFTVEHGPSGSRYFFKAKPV
jgi:hypothetical protein